MILFFRTSGVAVIYVDKFYNNVLRHNLLELPVASLTPAGLNGKELPLLSSFSFLLLVYTKLSSKLRKSDFSPNANLAHIERAE